MTDNYRALIWIPKDKLKAGITKSWKKLTEDFPEVKFFFMYDYEDYLQQLLNFQYIPLLRPHCLEKHFAEYPELKEDAIFYIDADIIFTKRLDFSKFVDDDVNYLSSTNSYTGAKYFDSKVKDVLPERLGSYKTMDVLEEVSKLVGVSRKICEDNDTGAGGAQYLLKNIDAKFWADVSEACKALIVNLRMINKFYFASEDKGFQSWASDMWALTWTLWRNGQKTVCPKELDFAWATDNISKWDEVYIYHDAGGCNNPILFDKRKQSYVDNQNTPFDENLSHVSPDYCSYRYVEAIKDAKPY